MQIVRFGSTWNFQSVINTTYTDYSTPFFQLPVDTAYTSASSDWVKSSGNAISATIKTNVSNNNNVWLNFQPNGFAGGTLTRTYPENLGSGLILVHARKIPGNHMGIYLLGVNTNIKIVIGDSYLEVFELVGSSYVSLGTVSIDDPGNSYEAATIYFNSGGVYITPFSGSATSFLTSGVIVPNVIQLFADDSNLTPSSLNVIAVNAFGVQRKNLDFTLGSLPAEPGDVMILSVHEGFDSTIQPRVSGQFTPLGNALSINGYPLEYQRFWTRTITDNEPSVYQFTRGDDASYYDSPQIAGVVVRNALAADLTVTYTNFVSQILSSSQPYNTSENCNPNPGDLVFGWGTSDDYNLDLVAVPGADEFLSRQNGGTRDFAALREAGSGNGVMVFFADYVGNAGQGKSIIVSARISSSAPTPTVAVLGPYQIAQPEMSPGWQRSATGQRYLEAVGKVKDQAGGRAIDSVTARFAKLAPEDALPLIAKDRGLERYPNEPIETFRERIRHPHEYWRKVGTESGMLEELARAGWTASIVALYNEDPNLWSQFDLIVIPANPTITRWNQFKWNQKPWNFSSNAVPFPNLRALVNKIKPAHYVCRHLYLSPTLNVLFWNKGKWNSGKKWGGRAQE